MGLYEELLERKQRGEAHRIKNFAHTDLKRLFIDEEKSDKQIAELFDVKPSRITYLRRKYGITIRNGILDEFLLGRSDKARILNEEAKQDILQRENVNIIAKAVTHFAFRNGPVEDMHSNRQLSEEDMKTLNKFMVNRLAYIFSLIVEERWIELNILVRSHDSFYGHNWDEAEVDDGDMRKYIELQLKGLRNR